MERRSHKRLLTLRNAGKAALVMAILFVAVTVASEIHRPKQGEYGRLFSSETPKSETITKEVKVVTEAPVQAQPAETTALVDDATTTAAGLNGVVVTQAQASQPLPRISSGERVTIVGGPDGVSVQRGANVEVSGAPVRHLSGGFFRQ